MSKKQKNIKSRSNDVFGKQARKKEIEKKTDYYNLHKNTIWTIVVIVVLVIFFIINNTRKVPDQGPYPPNYKGVDTSSDSSIR
jgi:hypothetical protein